MTHFLRAEALRRRGIRRPNPYAIHPATLQHYVTVT